MAELQPIARDGRMSQLGSCYPNGGDEPNTSSTHPMRLHPGHGKSPQAPSCLGDCSSDPCRPHGRLTRRRFCQDLWDCTDPRLPYPRRRRRWLALPLRCLKAGYTPCRAKTVELCQCDSGRANKSISKDDFLSLRLGSSCTTQYPGDMRCAVAIPLTVGLPNPVCLTGRAFTS